MIRMFTIRFVAISLLTLSPFLIWWQWKNQQTQGAFDIKQAFEGTPTIAPTPDPINILDHGQTWTNQEGEIVSLADLKGKSALVGFVYTQCTFACSVLTLRMKEVENWLPAEKRNAMQFLSFSIDPERDTPERLKDYASRFDISFPPWHFFVAPDSVVKDLTKDFSFYYKKEGDVFVHSEMIGVLDRNGVLRHQFWGSHTPNQIVDTLQQLEADGKL